MFVPETWSYTRVDAHILVVGFRPKQGNTQSSKKGTSFKNSSPKLKGWFVEKVIIGDKLVNVGYVKYNVGFMIYNTTAHIYKYMYI